MPMLPVKLVRFGATSALSFVTNIGGTALLHEVVGLPEELAYFIILIVVFWQNFLLCRYLVFRSTHVPFGRQVMAFLTSTIGLRALEYATFLVLLHALHIHYLVSVILVSGVYTLIKYFIFGNRVFPEEEPS